MDSISLKAYAKINIGLDITGKREDGYHLLKTCMQSINIYDVVSVSKGVPFQEEEIKITSDSENLPLDKTNIAWKAAALVKEKFGISDPVVIDITKNIPAAAGLAGGSSDGAAVIKAMNVLFGLRMDLKAMDEIAAKLGADVPFCLRTGLWLCEGIGEILTPLFALEGVCAVVVKPWFEVSTKWCYERYDALENNIHPDIDAMLAAAAQGDLALACRNCGNVLELVSAPAHPEIYEMKKIMMLNGAQGAFMSGSGGTVFGLFSDMEKARQALRCFEGSSIAQCAFLAEFVNPAPVNLSS